MEEPRQQLIPTISPEVQDVEEGEISDSSSASSVEEITEEDFNKHDHHNQQQPTVSINSAAVTPAADLSSLKSTIVIPESTNTTLNHSTNSNNNPSNNNQNLNHKNSDFENNTNSVNQQATRVWTMRDLYEYQITRNYSRGVHNLAWASWASAVKSKPSDSPKPLDEVVVLELPKTTEGNASLQQDVSSENAGSAKGDGSPVNGSGSDIGVGLPENSGSATSGDCVKQDGSPENKGANVVHENKDAIVVIEIDDEKTNVMVEEEEKEEGELEEGEIDLEADVFNPDGNAFHVLEVKAADLKLKTNSILEGLENVDVEYAEKSFKEVYSLAEDLLESLHELAEDISLAKKKDLIQLMFTAIKSLQTVFPSMSENQKDQMGESMKRFVASLMAREHPVLSAEQLKEMEVMVSSMHSSSAKVFERNDEMPVIDGFTKSGVDIYSENPNSDLINDSYVDAIPMDISDESEADEATAENLGVAENLVVTENLVVAEVGSNYKGLLLPLLDLHKDHDADSLPSPTREAPSSFPISKALGIGGGKLKPEWPVPRISLGLDVVALHPYESDAVKALSTYQQKFGRSSFLMNDELPSPTPSENNDTADGDISGEISSSIRNVDPLSVSAAERPGSSLTPMVDNRGGQVFRSWSSTPVSLGQNLQPKPRSRDPRLQLVNSDGATCDTIFPNEPKGGPAWGLLGSRKQKTVEDPVVGQPALKKPRHEFIESRIVHSGPPSLAWRNDGGTVNPEFGNDPRKPGNTVGFGSSGSITPNAIVRDNLPVAVPSGQTALKSLLDEISVNPSLLIDFIEMERQKAVAPTKNTTQLPSLNLALGSAPLMSSVTPSPSVVMRGSSGPSQVILTTPAEEPGIMRMKPRDPRRALHSNILQNNILQKGGGVDDQSLGKPTITLSAPGRASFLNKQKHEDNLEKKSIPTPSSTGPDITTQFTKNLKNIADLVSVSQSTSSQTSVSHMAASQPAQAFQGKLASSVASDFIQTGAGLASKEVSAVSSQPQNNWGDVEHLFDGFDDQQKAAIQRERARRMEEQRKMFAARKLCLVLDLDHTLLNSAKFDEVDPVHHEILRKREEEDREKEKPQRHLFRFPHMGMWTKLRPGIWNFLERAGRLYELHLYTMGNKLYATEMAKLLDPKGELFAGRVISRGDDGDPADGEDRVPKSKDLEGVLGMESAVVIIDDSIRVWPHNKLNLIVVERYIYFPCSRRQFGLPGPSLLEIDHDERTEDGTLASSLSVIETIHSKFFSHQSLHEADVRNILASEQRKILAGCRVVFSRVFPVGEAKPHLHPLWQTAEQFGAVCTNSIDEHVTHVVANSLGTDKVNWALSTGRFVVRPGWVEASTLLYRRANEHDFAIKQ